MGLGKLAKNGTISTLHELVEATHDAYLARDAAAEVEAVDVSGAGRRLAVWPPLLSAFSRVTRLALHGHTMTCLPCSLGDMRQLQARHLAVTQGTLLSLPAELGQLASLRDLDLGRNELAMWPAPLSALTGLTSLNLMGNKLKSLPDAFGDMVGLQKLGLKSNVLAQLPDSFTRLTDLVELFITDNRLTELPEGFCALESLVKLQASFNPWRRLPADLLALPRLELFRLAAGELPAWPAVPSGGAAASAAAPAAAEPRLPPSLAWCSLGGNPAAAPVPDLSGARAVDLSEVEVDRSALLGDGASGECFRAKLDGREVALKLFLAEVSPDGKAQDEVAISAALHHPNLTRVVAVVYDRRDRWPAPAAPAAAGGNGDAAGSPSAGGAAAAEAGAVGGGGEHAGEAARGLVQELVKGRPLASKPTSEHLLRCKWPEVSSFMVPEALAICGGLASALAYLHARRVCHGDVYAHNVLYCPDTRHAVLCDFGASFCYHEGEEIWELMEARSWGLGVRAFGLFARDVAARVAATDAAGAEAAAALSRLAERCAAVGVEGRPRFEEAEREISGLAAAYA